MTTEEIEKAANDYANRIPQHEDRKRYCREDFLAGVEWMEGRLCNIPLDRIVKELSKYIEQKETKK